ncbi:putative T7SS-secreted protein [Streptomyces chryseus]|uniref:Type IV secretion protein Rhs n=1 Tax=Streptomyces chryseus TaxID=68186 RepID=A0ABQ3E5E4_9ACTN|nr:DUF6531 domain-containing protein [Streptomyces chryseus]GHB23014.1 hypothetical protein GCM10010346_53250 [Streptomyces chryseus]
MSETIGANDTPKDLIPGNVTQLQTLDITLSVYADAFQDAKMRLKTVDEEEWQGTTALDFRSKVRHIPDTLDTAHDEFAKAAKAVRDYSEVLEEAQRKAKPIIEDAAEARQASKNYQRDVDDYNAAVERRDDPLPQRPPETDPGGAAMGGCVSRLNALRAQVDEAARVAKPKLDAAAGAAPDEPGWFKQLLGGGKNLAKGFYEGLDGLGSLTDTLTHPSRWGMQLASVADGLMYGVQNPTEFAKSIADWDTMKNEPARWVGRLGPDVLLGLATGGAGAAATRSSSAARRIAERARRLREEGRGRDDAHNRPDDVCRSDGDKCKTGEPVDIATGEMSLTRTDLTLPGAFPLILQRTHLSNYGAGGWFGPSWAATLDQHLEVGENDILFAGADGMLLAYPCPDSLDAVYPSYGPRWPLHRDGTDEAAYRITDPATGRTLHFAPHPATGHPLTAIENRAGHRIDIDYDAETGRPTAVRHYGGYRVDIDTHPELPRITALRLDDTLLISYGYDEFGNLTTVTNSSDQPHRFTYDDADRITTWTDSNGSSFGYVYDHTGRVLRTLGPDGMWSGSFRYEPADRRTTYTDSLGHATVYEYDEHCKLTHTADPLGNRTTQQWTRDGRHLASITDALGHTTRFERDDVGNLTAVLMPDGSHATAVYNELNLPVLVTEPGGITWQYTYDQVGNRLSTTGPTGATTAYDYNETGHLSAVTDALGHTRWIQSNSAGLPMVVTNPDGNSICVTRDSLGRTCSITDALGSITRLSWTVEGKPLRREYNDGSLESWTWDGEGNLLTYTDQAGNTTRRTYTHFGLPASRTDPNGAEFRFSYDTELQLTSVTNPAGLTWSYTHDEAGHLAAETDFNGRSLKYIHDPAGRLVSRTNGAGETETFTRDPLGRVTAHAFSDNRVSTYAYAPTGQIAAMTNPDAVVDHIHDPLGRLLSETINGRTTSYTYDALGRRTSRTTPSGLISTWDYGTGPQPLALSNSAGHRLDFGYNVVGQEITRIFDDNAFLLQTWDAGGRLASQSIRNSNSAADPVQDRQYTYRPDGYLTQLIEHTTGTRRFTLSSAGRVTTVTGSDWSESYAYDTTGNVTSAITATTADTDGPRELSGTLLHRAGRTRFTYDAQGRLVRRTRRLLSGQTRHWTYSWNAEDRLAETTTPDGTRWRYIYDPTGRRIAKHRVDPVGEAAECIHFTWEGTRLAEQTAADGTVTSWDYTPGTHRPLVQTERRPRAIDPRLKWLTAGETSQDEYDSRFHAIITDLVGTPTELLNADGEIVWHYRTALWGSPLPAPTGRSDVDCPLRFPGQYADPETGLHYNNQRYFDPETARYLTPDPLRLGPADNHHAYVPNPYAGTDPLGLMCVKIGDADPASQQGNLPLLADKIAAHGDINKRGIPGVDDEDVAEYLEDMMAGSEGRKLRDTQSGTPRWAWWDDETGTMLIREGNNGTFMQPSRGHDYYMDQLKE